MRADYARLPNTIVFYPVGDDTVKTLELYINPESLTKSYTQIVSKIQTRGGFVVQHWGEQLTSIEASGKSGAFFVSQQDESSFRVGIVDSEKPSSISKTLNVVNEAYGLANPAADNAPDRKNAKAWIAFRSFIDLYRQSTLLAMSYDGYLYMGNFTNFSWDEDATNPFFITYSFSFTVLSENKEIA
jgi:hypothetical protein